MEYSEFLRLAKLGEMPHADRKIECHAFESKNPDSARAKAELAKDICAMANNGSRASYLLIGVSDDGRHLKSVTNANLTDDNLQAFCKDAIAPPPRVTVHNFVWPSSTGGRGQRLIAIQIGPNPKNAYRLNRDFIDFRNADPRARCCFRRNEVWIRRGATSDIATPEEIARLIARKKIAKAEDDAVEAVDFQRLEANQQQPRMLEEARKLFTELGYPIADLSSENPAIGFRVTIPIGSQRLVFRCVGHQAITSSFSMIQAVGQQWQYEHGMFIFLLDQISKSAFPYVGMSLNLKESWGFFSKIRVGGWNLGKMRRYIRGLQQLTGEELFPFNFEQADLSVITLTRCSSSHRLRERLSEACSLLRSDAQAQSILEEGANALNKGLQKLLREGWIYGTNTFFFGESKLKPKKGQFIDARWPNRISVRFRDARLTSAVRSILRLSNAKRTTKR
jgi:hypothetical protein